MATVTSSKRQQTHTSNTYESNSSVTVGTNVIMNTSCTVDGRDVSVDGAKLDGIACGATSCTGTGDITAVTAGNGLTGGASSGAATLNVGAGTAITVAADTVGVNSTCNSTWNAKTTCTGTTTPSNTQTFTNKSGCISQWTNNSGYTTCTGTGVGNITCVTTSAGLDGAGSSGTVTVSLDLSELTDMTAAVVPTTDEIILLDNGAERRKLFSEIFGCNAYNSTAFTTCIGDVTGVTAGSGLTGGGSSGTPTLNVGAGTAITVAADTVGVTTACNSAWNGKTTCTGTTTPSNTQTFTNKSGCISQWNNDSGYTTCTGDITAVVAGTDLTGGATSGSATLNVTSATASTASKIVKRDSSGHIFGNYFNGAGTFSTTGSNVGMGVFTGTNGSDTYGRSYTAAAARTLLNVANGATACTGTTTASNSQTFTNKTGCISQWINDSGYTTCTGTGDITAVTAGNGLTGGASSGAATLNVGAGTAITVAADTVSVNSTCNSTWNAKTTCTGTTTPSNTQTFTNKSGCISQWTNDANYTANATTCTGNLCSATAQCIYDSNNNFKIGNLAGSSLTTGTHNFAAGEFALRSLTSTYNNIAIGRSAGCSNVSSPWNTFIGPWAGKKLASGAGFNVAIGVSALCSAVCTYGNIAIGSSAMKLANDPASFPSGNYNVAINCQALHTNTSGANNTAIGYNTLCNNTTGNHNIALGWNALQSNTTGGYNVALGSEALCTNTTTSYNFAVGWRAMKNNTGCGNTAIGQMAMCGSTASNAVAIGKCTLKCATGNSNVAIGAQAGQNISSGYGNLLFGAIAGYGITTGSSNVYIGDQASRYNVSGANNVAIGKYAGRCHASGTKASGSNNVYIGQDARAGASNSANEIVIGCGAQGCGSNTIRLGNTSITGAYVQTSWTTTSDVRDKTCVADLDKGLCFIGDLQPKSYMWRCARDSEETKGQCAYGFLAQDILALEDKGIIVDDADSENLSMKNDYLIPILVKGMQDQQDIIEKLEKRIEALES